MKHLVQEKLKELEQTVKLHLAEKFIPSIRIEYTLNKSTALGTCSYINYPKEIIINLNEYLLNELKELYINEVLVHEYAHAVIKMIYPDGYNRYSYKRVQPHGKEFKKICRLFGIDGKATTTIANNISFGKRRNIKKFYYKCNCVGYKELTTIRHNKVQRGQAEYACSICKNKLQYAGN